MSFQVNQRVAFKGGNCFAGKHCGLPGGATGTIKECLLPGCVVEWDDHDGEANITIWCRGCLRPIDDPKAQEMEDFAEGIGWKIPTKEIA